jgi:hypothetical protein
LRKRNYSFGYDLFYFRRILDIGVVDVLQSDAARYAGKFYVAGISLRPSGGRTDEKIAKLRMLL